MSRPVASDNDGIHHPVAYGAVAERGLKKLYGALFLCFFFLMLVLPTTYQLQRGAVLAVLVIIGVGLASTHWKLERAPLVVWLMTSASGVFFILWGLMHAPPAHSAFPPSTYSGLPVHALHRAGDTATTDVPHEGIGVWDLCRGADAVVGRRRCFARTAGIGDAMVRVSRRRCGSIQRIYRGDIVQHGDSHLRSPVPYCTCYVSEAFGLVETQGGGLVCVVTGSPRLSGVRTEGFLAPLSDDAVNRPQSLLSSERAIAVAADRNAGARYGCARNNCIERHRYFSYGRVPPVPFSVRWAGEQSANLRLQQWGAMVDAWKERPLLGHGLGATLHSITRSETMPWSYELFYGALLFKIGLVGVTVYAVATGWVFYAGIKVARRSELSEAILVPLLAGLAGFLVVNATNPYLLKFDYRWTIFLPVAAINAFHLRLWPST